MNRITACLCFIFLLTGYSYLSAQTTYYSSQTGDWDQASTWGGLGPPNATDHAVIQSGHTVTIKLGGAGTFITNMTIEAGGVLDADNKEMNVSGTFIVNGVYTSFEGAAQDLNFDGDSLGGIGTITVNKNTSYFIFADDVVILPTTQLNVFGHIIVDNNVTVTNKGLISVTGDIDGSNGTTSVWNNDVGSTVEVKSIFMNTGVLNASAAGNTVKYLQQADQAVTSPSSLTYDNLSISGIGTKSMSSDLIINGNLTISSGIFDCNGNNLTINGDWINNADYTEGTGTVLFSGTGDQTITNPDGELFYNLTINKFSGTLALENNVSVSNILSMTSGVIEVSGGVFTLGTGIGNTGALNYTDGLICGPFERWINLTSTFLFPIGKQNYQPLNLTLNGLTTGGTIIAEFFNTDPGLSGLPLYDNPDSIFNTFVDGYWNLTTANGFDLGGGNTYDISVDGTGFSAFTINNSTRVLIRDDSGSDWVVEGSHVNPVGSAARRSGLSTLGAEFAFGDTTNCSRPVTSSITGIDEVCTSTSGVSYAVTNSPPNTYTWIITGGTQVSGGNTNSITVDWGPTGMADANVRVIESNTCTNGAPVDLPVTIHTIQPKVISGRTAVAELTTEEPYFVDPVAGYTYTWTITGGTQVSGTNTDSITVDWGTNGTGIVSVEAQKGVCALSPATELSVKKYVIIESDPPGPLFEGDWDDPTTWDCNCVPLPTENVRINNGHTVKLIDGGAGTEVNNFIIKAGGVLNPNNRIMTIHSNFEIYGTYLGGTKDLVMDGFDSYINGTGTLQQGIVLSANMEFSSTAVINISAGDVEIEGGVEVTNYGSVTVADNIVGLTGTSQWTNASNSTLRIGTALLATGVLEASATGNTVNYNGTGAQTIKSPSSNNYYNLTTSGSGTKTMSSALDIDGDVTLNGTATLDVSAASNYTINLAGDWTNTGGTFNEQLGSVILDGSSDQTITGAETFYGLNMTNSSGLYLNNNTTVSNLLTMGGGNIYPQTNTLTIGSGAGSPGDISYTSGIVIGKLERWATSTATAMLYPIGTAGNYRPATITYTDLGVGSVIGEFIASNPGSTGLPLSEGNVSITNQYTEGYWDLTAANGLTTNNFDIQLTATNFTSYTIIPGTRIIRDSSDVWVLDGTHVSASAPDLYRTGLTRGISTSGSTFGIGHVVCSGLSLDRSITDVTCYGDGDGAIDITVNGGTAPYTYTWGHGPTTEDVSGLSGGSYSVNVTDADGCEIDSTWTVDEPAALSIAHTESHVTCNGGSDGSIDITVSGGTPVYTYSWSHGPTTEDVGTLSAGSYTVTVTDANLCTLDSTISITEPTALTATINSTDVTCNSGSDGTITLSAPSGGSGVYQYTVTGGGSWQDGTDFTGLVAGSYDVRIRDKTYPACEVTLNDAYAIDEPTAIQINRVITDVTCYSGSDGAIDITPSDGTPGYSYSWSHGPTTEDINGLSAGLYTVTVTDANLCTQDSTFTVAEPTAIQIGKSITDVSCNAGSDGAIDITPSGGTPGYTFSWSHGPTTENVSGLSAGSYTVTVTDANLCAQDSTFTISEPASSIIINRIITNVSMPGGNDGAIDITASGGTPAYTYSWNHGPSTEDVSGLSAGIYTVTVMDANSCTQDSTFAVTEPGGLIIGKSITNISCNGSNDGEIDITIYGGTPGYTYSWSHGPTTEDVTGLSFGLYTVTVTDAIGTSTDSTFSISEPDATVINRIISDISCYNGTDGEINITPSGGTPGYTYSWSHGPTTQDVSGLSAGSYTVTITDTNLCTLDSTFTLAEPAAIQIGKSITDVSCNGGSDGAIDITPSGGTPGYTFSWSHGPTIEDVNGLSAGDYTITINDANSCTLDSTFTITEPAAHQLPILATSNRDSICPGDGDIILSFTEGVPDPGSTAEWYSDDQFVQHIGTGNDITISTPISTTTYYVRYESACGVTDAVSVKVNIKNLSTEPVNAASDRDGFCPGDGSIVLSYSGGTLGNGAEAFWYTDTLFTELIGTGNDVTISAPESNIIYYVRFEGDCNVTQPAKISVNTTIESVRPDTAYIDKDSVCAGDGQIVLTYEGGIRGEGASAVWYSDPGFINVVGTGNDLSIPSPSVQTTYYVRFEGDCNTTGAVSATIHIISKPVPVFIEKVELVCSGSQDYWYVVSGYEKSTFSWNLSGGTIIENQNDSVLVRWDHLPGTYQLTVMEVAETGCQSDIVNLNVGVSSPTVSLGSDQLICEGEESVIIPVGDYSDHSWHDGTSTTTYTTSVSEQVIIIVEDESGCQATDSVFINMVPLPDVNLGFDTILCGESSLILDAGNEGSSYEWSTSETTQQIYVFAGQQEIWVIVTSEYGCIGSDTILIHRCSLSNYFNNIPNVFTPDGDNVNDTWYFDEAAGFPDMVVEVYDRWGRLIWRSERGYPDPWDGKSLTGAEMPVDSYYYVIELNDGSDQIIGTITIVK